MIVVVLVVARLVPRPSWRVREDGGSNADMFLDLVRNILEVICGSPIEITHGRVLRLYFSTSITTTCFRVRRVLRQPRLFN